MNINVKNLSKKFNNYSAVNNINFFLDKNKNYKMICVSSIPQTGIGLAINDRLSRAAK